MSTQPKGRRTAYIAGTILIIIILIGVGYYETQTGTGSVTTTTSVTSAYKDTLIVGTTDSVGQSLDPATAYIYFDDLMIQQLGSPLVDIRPGSSAGPNDIVPALATSWNVSQDGLIWTFNLRPDVKFGDGSCCFNASTVKYSFDRGIEINSPDGPFAGIGYGGPGGIINSTEVVSLNTVAFHLNYPFTPFLSLLTFAASYPVNPKYAPMAGVNYTDGDARHSTPMDFGPYILTEWKRVGGKDTEMKLDANLYYWNASGGYPRTPHIIVTMYSDETSLRLAIQSGDVDVAYRQLSPVDLRDLSTNSKVKVWEGNGAFIQYVLFNQRIKPFDDARVRRAIAAAINRTDLTNTVFLGTAIPVYSMIPIGMFAHQDPFKIYGDANYTYTREVLSQLGYNSTNKLVVDLWYESSGHYANSADIATVLKSSLEASGVIQVNLHGVDWATYWSNVSSNHNMPAFLLGWYPDYVDPDDYMYPLLHSQGSSGFEGAIPPSPVDHIIEEARSSTSATTREQLYAQAQQTLGTDVPEVPLFQGTLSCVTKPNVGGVVLDITGVFRYWLLYETAT